ncbi:hypothetical protein GQ457_16G022450 [Hibiscus cannabinus]
MVGEALSKLLLRAVEVNLFKGVEVGTNGFAVSHCQFANDLLIFADARVESIHNIKRTLRLFEAVSGLKLNLRKSKLFGINVEDSKTSEWAQFVGCTSESLPTEYLGMPLGYSRNSVELWKPILKKFHDRLEGWKGRLLSFGGRLTLLRSVFNNLPVYFMSLIQIPAGVADSLNKIMANFLWGLDSRRAIHWVKWEHVCRPKDHGGLGIFNVLLRNRSLLNKRICRFGSENGAFWRNVIDAKYGFDSLSLMPKQLSDRKASWLWRGIAKPLSNSNDLFSSGIRFKLGDGSRIEFWEDFFTEVRTLREAFPRIFNLSVKKSGKVGQFGHKESDKWVWSIATRRELFDWERRMWEEFMNVIERAASNTGREDKLVWINARDGDYSTNVYCLKASTLDAEPDKIWNVVWSGLVPPKVEGFLWKALLGRVLTLVELAKRGIFRSSSYLCALCSRESETVEHLFCHCEVVWRVWKRWAALWHLHLIVPGSLDNFLLMWDCLPVKYFLKDIWSMSFCCIIWSTWLCRNDVIFNSKVCNEFQLYDFMVLRLGHWCKSKWPSSMYSANDFLRNPTLVAVCWAKHQ